MNGAKFSGSVSAVFDMDFDMACGPQTPEIVSRKMHILKQMGFQCVHLVMPACGYANYNASTPLLGEGNYHLESLLNLGDPLRVYLEEARAASMRTIVIYKPYEGGGFFSLPHGMEPLLPRRILPQLGGNAFGFDPFLADHPEMRIRRFGFDAEAEAARRPACGLSLTFFHEKEPETEFPADLTLYGSSDNGRYDPLEFTRREQEEFCTIPGSGVERKCRKLTLNFQVSPEIRYFAISFSNPEGVWRTVPYSMLLLLDAEGRALPCTATGRIRKLAVPLRGGGCTGDGDFRHSGFEFQASDSVVTGIGCEQGCVYAVAAGTMEYLHGCYCEACPEVRMHWLAQVDRAFRLGADGIDFRLQCHSAGVPDFKAYGDHPLLQKRYRERYGDHFDYLDWMKIRGEFYLQFLHDARRLAQQQKKLLQIDVNADWGAPELDWEVNRCCFWAMPKILPDNREIIALADEIVLKDYHFGHYEVHAGDPVKDRCWKSHKPLWVHCYLQQGADLNEQFIAEINSDLRVTGMLIYEMVCDRRPGSLPFEAAGLFEVTPTRTLIVNEQTRRRLSSFLF